MFLMCVSIGFAYFSVGILKKDLNAQRGALRICTRIHGTRTEEVDSGQASKVIKLYRGDPKRPF